MKANLALPLFLLVGVCCGACGGSGEETAGVVQAATKAAGELGEQLAEKASVLAQKAGELAALKGEEARVKAQELVDAAAHELAEARDSQTVQRAAAEIEQCLGQVTEFLQALGAKLELAKLRQALDELVQRFRDDPDVQRGLAAIRTKLDALGW